MLEISSESRDCSGSRVTRLRAERRGFDFRAWLGIFLFATASLKHTQPPIQRVQGALSSGIERPGREANHSPPTSSDVKNAWSCTSTPPISFPGVVLN
jgi:hypothetical protein